jgi:hypothetical protein
MTSLVKFKEVDVLPAETQPGEVYFVKSKGTIVVNHDGEVVEYGA